MDNKLATADKKRLWHTVYGVDKHITVIKTSKTELLK